MPGARTKWTTTDGAVHPVWLNFLRDLHERTGGSGDDLIDGSATLAALALSAAQTAQASANDAHLLAFAAAEDAEQIDHELQKDDELLHFWFYD